MDYTGQFNAQDLTNWTSEWGGGTLPKAQHGVALITPGMLIRMTPGGAWDTFYQLQRMPEQNSATTVTYHVAYKVNDVDLPSCQAVEGEIQRHDGQHLLNGGFQFDIKGSKRFRTYDFSVGHWVATEITCDDSILSGGKTLDVVMVYDLAPQSITFRGVQINGDWNALNITRPAVNRTQNPYLNFATQADCTSRTNVWTLQIPSCDIVIT